MSEAAWAFEQVPLNLPRTKPVRRPDTLEDRSALEEMPVIPDVAGIVRSEDGQIRAYRVRSSFQRLGLQAGDCLLVTPSPRPEANNIVVVDLDGELSARRVIGRRGERLVFDPPIDGPNLRTVRVVGAFAGILRKRLAPSWRRAARDPLDRTTNKESAVRTSGKMQLLRGKLGMVEATCADTANPRLKRALRHEAARLRKQLQNEAGRNKSN